MGDYRWNKIRGRSLYKGCQGPFLRPFPEYIQLLVLQEGGHLHLDCIDLLCSSIHSGIYRYSLCWGAPSQPLVLPPQKPTWAFFGTPGAARDWYLTWFQDLTRVISIWLLSKFTKVCRLLYAFISRFSRYFMEKTLEEVAAMKNTAVPFSLRTELCKGT